MKKENCSIVTARKSRLAMRQWLLVIYSDRMNEDRYAR
jgi:hypothetical protein